MPNKLLVIIGGPTGIGKTSLTIQLARHFQSEIISADSRQVYKEMNIGVSKPTAEQLATVPHHLIGYTSVHDHYSAGQFTRDALNVLEDLFKKHTIVFMTGGTGLYLKGIMHGFDDMPDVPVEVNDHWTKIWKEKGVNELLIILEKHDPAYFQIVDRQNPMRLIRAVSFIMHTGLPFSSFHSKQTGSRPFRILSIALTLPRAELYNRINNRVINMMNEGWMKEAQLLYPFRHLKALQTVGYQELFDVIDHKITLDEAIPMIQQATRRYAKRQMTWWRNQGLWNYFEPSEVEKIMEAIKNGNK